MTTMAPGNFDQHFFDQFSSNVLYIAQQEGSVLRGTVMNEPNMRGDLLHFDQYGERDPIERTVRFGDSPVQAQQRASRQVRLSAYEDGDFLDNFDIARTLNDPATPLVRSMGMGFGRKMDDVILTAAIGTAVVGRATTTSVALPAANTVAINDHDFDTGSGDVGLTPGKLRAARAIYGANKVRLTPGSMHCVVTQYQIENMLSNVEVGSSDYNAVNALNRGEVDEFLGFKFHIVDPDLLPITSTSRTVITYHTTGIVFATNAEATADVVKRGDKSMNWYAYMSMFMGATRVEEGKVVAITCLES